MSEAVSPTTIIELAAVIWDFSAHYHNMSGAGRPRPASAGDTRNFEEVAPPEHVDQHLARARARIRSSAPPAARPRVAFRRWSALPGSRSRPVLEPLRRSCVRRRRWHPTLAPEERGEDLDLRLTHGLDDVGLGRRRPPRPPTSRSSIVRRKASSTRPLSSTVVPAMSKQISSTSFIGNSPPRWPGPGSSLDHRRR